MTRLSLKDGALAFFIVLLWASNFIILKKVLDFISLDFFNTLRLLIFVPLIFLLKKPTASFQTLSIMALTWNVGSLAFMSLALHSGLAASYAGLIMQFQVIFDLLISYFFLKETLTRVQIFGIMLAVSILIYFKLNLADPFTAQGFGFVIFATISVAIAVTYSKYKKVKMDLNNLLWILIMGAPMMLIYDGLFGNIHYTAEINWSNMIELLFYVTVSSLFSIFFGSYYWFKLNEKYPSIAFKPFLFLLPFIVYGESIFFLDESFAIEFFIILSLVIFSLQLCGKTSTIEKNKGQYQQRS